MPKDVHPPRGNRDFLPLEKQKRDAVLGVICRPAAIVAGKR